MSEMGSPGNESPDQTDPAPDRRPATDTILSTAAVAIEAAMVLTLVAALIGALAFDLNGQVEGWKVRAKLMSLSGQGLYGFTGLGGGVVVAVALLVALALARSADSGTPTRSGMVGGIAVAISLWLGLLIAVSIYVDVTEISQVDLAAATALSDLATLVMLVAAGWWGLAMTGPAKR